MGTDERKYSLDGDLNQMISQKKYLLNECLGFKLSQEPGSYPQINSEKEYVRALGCFFLDKVDGWWNYKNGLIKYEICTLEEFTVALRKQAEFDPIR
jgi:hypothetical protein